MALYGDDFLDEIRNGNDIVDVVGEYVHLKRGGKDFMGLCPFHKEKTPSFIVVPAKQIFYCFGCGKGGDIFQFIELIENLTYRESIALLADRAKIPVPEGETREDKEEAALKEGILKANTEAARFFHKRFFEPDGEAARRYLMARKISDSTLKMFGMGYSPGERDLLYRHLKSVGIPDRIIMAAGLAYPDKSGRFTDKFRGRVIFPIFDTKGKVVAFGGRILEGGSGPKYMNSPETPAYKKSRILYALNLAKSSGKREMIMVEGYMDAITLHQAGITNTVASLGTALTELQARTLKKYADEVIISYDSDTAGQSAALRGMDILDRVGCSVKVIDITKGKDPDEFVRTNGAEAFLKLAGEALPLVEYKARSIRRGTDISTTEGSIRFLTQMAQMLAGITNDVKREMYVNKLSKEYGISTEGIAKEIIRYMRPAKALRDRQSGDGIREAMKKADQLALKSRDAVPAEIVESSSATPEARAQAAAKMAKTAHLEMSLIALICTDNRICMKMGDTINAGIFTVSENMEVAKRLINHIKEGREITPAEIAGMYKGDMAGIFSKILINECNCEDNIKAAGEIAGKLNDIKLFTRREEILAMLGGKDGSVDQPLDTQEMEKLQAELNSLVIRKKGVGRENKN